MHPKECDGLGFQHFNDINLALLAKVGWTVATGEKGLALDIFRAKHFHGKSFWSYKLTKGTSYTWHCIMSSRKALTAYMCYKIGDGKDMNRWKDPWLLELPDKVLPAKEGVDTSQWDRVEKLKTLDGNRLELGPS